MSEITLVRQPGAKAARRVPSPDADRVRELLEYDAETGVFSWRVDRVAKGRLLVSAGSVAGTRTKQRRWIISVDGRQYYAHHLAWLVMTGEWPDEVDHRNTDALDNAWANLRLADDQLNAENKRQALSTNKSSGVLGVSRSRKSRTNPWKAQIRFDGRIRYLGSFPTIDAAHEAYVAAKRIHHAGCTL